MDRNLTLIEVTSDRGATNVDMAKTNAAEAIEEREMMLI